MDGMVHLFLFNYLFSVVANVIDDTCMYENKSKKLLPEGTSMIIMAKKFKDLVLMIVK